MQLVILGYHRSGTSAATQHLSANGLFIGDDLLGSNSSNPYGHFEDRVFIGIHERILRENGKQWLAPEPFVPVVTPQVMKVVQQAVAARDARHAHWGFKDPRSCLFIDLWRTVLSDPRFVVCIRHYKACIDSIVRRAMQAVRTTPERNVALISMRQAADEERVARSWIAHMLPLLRLMRRHPDIVQAVNIGTLDGSASLAGDLSDRFGVPLARGALSETFDARVYRAEREVQTHLPAEIEALAERVWLALGEAVTALGQHALRDPSQDARREPQHDAPHDPRQDAPHDSQQDAPHDSQQGPHQDARHGPLQHAV